MAYKTPGVYIKEIPLFPPSVAQVETAIPAFIGYTEKAVDPNGKVLSNLPVKIKSLVEFQSLFGLGHTPAGYTVVADAAKAHALVSITPDKRFYLYEALRQFYDNGGGDCYIVSVGPYQDSISSTKLIAGLNLLRKFDEPTLLLAPDAVGLKDGSNNPDLANFSDFQKFSLKQCAELQDRFSILDILEGDKPEDTTNKPITNFRDNSGINSLSYGAAYYPWIVSSYPVEIGFRQIHLFDKADLATEITDFAPYSKDKAEKDLVAALTEAMGYVDESMVNITAPVINKSTLRRQGIEYLQGLLSEYESKIAANSTLSANMTNYLNVLAGVAVSFRKADVKAVAGTGFRKDIDMLIKDKTLTDALATLVSVEKNPKTQDNTDSRKDPEIDAIYAQLEKAWFGDKTYVSIAPNGIAYTKNSAGCLKIINDLAESTKAILNGYQRLLDAALFYEKQAQDSLFANHVFFHGMKEKILELMRTIPPSGTVAGVYSAIDRTRGVWKAPANVSINSVIGPSVKIDNHDQEDLNVHPTGKSINAIRAFTGKGTLIWGSRTLAGNDNEWRYIPVRRFFIMVEESTKKASEPFVFEPNDANTWVKVRAMIENFLVLQWRAGALQGAKPEDAFFVRVGLNETMTELDILEGRMIIEIGMAVVRPAEFIILRFSHKMLSAKS